MKLPKDDNEINNRLSPAMMLATVTVVLIILVIFITVLAANSEQLKEMSKTKNNSSQQAQNTDIEKETKSSVDSIVPGTLQPEDLDFWDKYPIPETNVQDPEETNESTEQMEALDPSQDGKHTKIFNESGEEEWILINPYLERNSYDFTRLVCQSGHMKYYDAGKQTSFLGVDISKYQDYVDFNKLRKAGMDFVLLRVGARGYSTGQIVMDEAFLDNIKRASDAGLQVGVYFSSQAINEAEAVEEANLVLETIKDYTVTYPIVYAMESIKNDTARTDNLGKNEKTQIAKKFLNTIANAGYVPMLYGSKEYLLTQVDLTKLATYDIYLKQDADIPDYPYRFTMWKYDCGAGVDGIAVGTDLIISFIDYVLK